MAYSKIIFNGDTLMDVTQVTVAPEVLHSGDTATKNDGTKITGTYAAPSGTVSISTNGVHDVTNYEFADVEIEESISYERKLALVNRIISSQTYYNSNMSTIGPEAFARLGILNFDLPNVEAIYSGVSRDFIYESPLMPESTIRSMVTISLPNLKYVGTYAFAFATAVAPISIYSPNIEYIEMQGFHNISNCVGITLDTLSKLSHAERFAFFSVNGSGMQNIYYKNLEFLGDGGFTYCYSIKTCILPKLSVLYASTFAFCSSLTMVSFDHLTAISASSYTNPSNGNTYTYSSAVFWNCNSMRSMYLLGSSMCILGWSNALNSSPFKTSVSGEYASIFVPASLYGSYVSATNWVQYSARIVSLTSAQIEALS